MTANFRKKPLVLLILDGWGHREATDYNAIAHANTPTWDHLREQGLYGLISSSGLDVGLPEGQMGNSEVGHMSLGAGRVIYQNISRIDKEIETGNFFNNSVYNAAIDKALANDGAVHIMGLMSPGGVHSHDSHILAAIKLAAQRGCNKVYLHAFLDGRDTPPRSALPSLQAADRLFDELACGRTASLIGRYYAMDRDNRWDRVQLAYDLLTEAKGEYNYSNSNDALTAAYQRNEDDEFVRPSVICPEGQVPASINDGDAILFMNFRADRAREISYALLNEDFDGFNRNKRPSLADFVMTTEYAGDLQASCAYPSTVPAKVLGEYLADQGLTQLRIAETEKYAHVTFFFSGGREELYQGEQRVLVKSPNVATYDLQPEMSAPELTDKLVSAIHGGEFDVIICNYANGDMVGHTGNFEAAIKAAEVIDHSVKRVTEAVLEVGGDCLITADHGNCEMMLDANNEKHTQHTTELVPFVYVGSRKLSLSPGPGRLCDVAPTMLSLLNLPKPEEMTGHTLLLSAS